MYRTSLSEWRPMPPSQESASTKPVNETTEFDGIGVINETSNTFSIVSVTIDGSQREFYFSKGIFYAFGIKCDGHMGNILEKGMDVNLSYKKCHISETYFVTAVWLGDKPNALNETGSLLSAVYSQKGRVSSVHGDSIVVQCDTCHCSVLVNKLVMFREECPLDESELRGTIGENVIFDAIPIQYEEGQRKHPSNAEYQATCCWIGTKGPRFVDRFALHVKEEGEPIENEELTLMGPEDVFHGIVSVVPSDVVAFVDVESVGGKVILFRSSFKDCGQRVGDNAAVGDALCLQLQGCLVFPGRRQWFATRAWKDGIEVNVDEKSRQILNIKDRVVKNTAKLCGPVHEPTCIDVASALGAIEVVDSSGKDERFEVAISEEIAEAAVDVGFDETAFELALSQRSQFSRCNDGDGAASSLSVEKAGNDVSTKPAVQFTVTSEVLFDYPALTGIIQQFSFDSACVLYENLHILTERNVIYIDGNACSLNQFLDLISPGKNVVSFEAVLSKYTKASLTTNTRKKKFTHVATCVWVGEKPSIENVVLSSFPSPNFSILKNPKRKFRGVVSKFCLPRIALVDVIQENTTVCLHVSAFGEKPKPLNEYASGEGCITNFVKRSNFVEFKVRRVGYGPLIEAFDVEKPLPPQKKKKMERNSPKNLLGLPKPNTQSEREGNVRTSSLVHGPTYFLENWPSKRRKFLLDFSGVLRFDYACRGVKIECALGLSSPLQNTLIYGCNDDKPLDWRTDRAFNGREIRFDAEAVEFSVGYGCFHVGRVWVPGNNRPKAELNLISVLSYKGLKTILKSRLYHGVIKSIPYHDSALAEVRDSVVLVPLESLVTRTFKSCHETIDMFLGTGYSVRLKVEEASYPDSSGSKFLKAVECFYLKNITGKSSTEDQNLPVSQVDRPRAKSWKEVWGFGEYYHTSLIVRRNEHYCVEFTSTKRSGINLRLNLFTVGSFFVDGVLTDPEAYGELEGREVTFHVSHVHPARLTNSSYGMMIFYTWIGKEPSPFALLKDKLTVPKGVICSNSQYECVVIEFPLPTHAICRIGFVPVLVPLAGIENNGAFVTADTDLALKELALVRVHEETEGEDTYLVASETKTNYLWNGILRDLTGTVVTLPSPVGIMKVRNTNIEVSFEVCHLRGFAPPKTNYLSRINYMKEMTKVGTEVRFTAFKANGKIAPYRAIEVWLVREQDSSVINEPIKNVTTNEPIKNVTCNEPIKHVTTNEPIKHVTTNEPLRNVTTNEPIRNVTTTEPIRNVTTIEPIRNVTTTEPIRNVTTNEPIRNVTTTEPIRNVTTNEPIRNATTNKPKENVKARNYSVAANVIDKCHIS